MLNFINKGDSVIDIGANIGAFTVPFAKKVGKMEKYMVLNHKNLFTKFWKKILILIN